MEIKLKFVWQEYNKITVLLVFNEIIKYRGLTNIVN